MRDRYDVMSNPLAWENIGKLIMRFAIPAIISMLVGALYNIVDQIFIGRSVGMLGNAAPMYPFPDHHKYGYCPPNWGGERLKFQS